MSSYGGISSSSLSPPPSSWQADSSLELPSGIQTLPWEDEPSEEGYERVDGIIQPLMTIEAVLERDSSIPKVTSVECSTSLVASIGGCDTCFTSYIGAGLSAERDRVTDAIQERLKAEMFGKSLVQANEGPVDDDGSYPIDYGVRRQDSDGKLPSWELPEDSVEHIIGGMQEMWEIWLKNSGKDPLRPDCQLSDGAEHKIIPVGRVYSQTVEDYFAFAGLQARISDVQSFDSRKMLITSTESQTRTVFSVYFGVPIFPL